MNWRTLVFVSVIVPSIFMVNVDAHADMSGQERAYDVGKALVGTAAPNLVVRTIDGETIDLSNLYGKKAVYIKFWATWCTPCREQMPHFERTYEAAGADLAVIAINVGFNDSIEEVKKYRRRMGITMPIVFDDGRLGAAFHLRVTPQHIIIGRNGRIEYVGHLADQALDAALLAARTQSSGRGSTGTARGQAPLDAPHFEIGDLLPVKSVKTLEGQSFHFRTHGAPRPTVLVFISPWCESYLETTRPAISASCRNAREQVSALADDRRVRWLGVASGLWATPQDLLTYQSKSKLNIPLTLDESGALFREFRVTNVPTVLIADANGKIVQRFEINGTQDLGKVLESL